MFDNAKSEIVIGQFYAVVKPGSVFRKWWSGWRLQASAV
jgi:hypothetical protein